MTSGLPVDTTDIIMSSWSKSTQQKYATYINQWLSFCESNGTNYLHATTKDGLKYLTQVFNNGRHYHTVAAARSALSSIIPSTNGILFGEQPLVTKFVKGVSKLRPPFPKYSSVWDAGKVLDFFRSLPDNQQMTLKQLTLKVTTLLCLVLCQRAQTIHSFRTDYLQVASEGLHIAFPSNLKTTRPGYHPEPVLVPRYPADVHICPVAAVEAYLLKTEALRGSEDKKLMVSYVSPYKGVSTKTISRWLKKTLSDANIDVSIFQGHSVRAAGTCKAKAAGVPIPNILKMAGWTGARTFAKHYDKPVLENVSLAILS